MADEPLTVDDGEYTPAGENDDITVEASEVYLRTDDGERKATGSYYTPEYIVEYIVDETLGPLVDEIRTDLMSQSADTTHSREGGFADEFADRIFDLTVLDPAMGSGHFPVNAVDYLARKIIDAQEKQDRQAIDAEDAEVRAPTTKEGELRDINWARRKVAQRCIYGVDVNPLATELAKVSLWLRTLAAEQPLAFLDHHLKTGNSLVGSDIEDVLSNGDDDAAGDGQLTLQQSFDHTRQRAMEHVTDRFQDLLNIDNETLEDAKEMEAVYDDVRADPLYKKLLTMANVHTADAFGLEVPDDADERMARALQGDAWEKIAQQDWFRSAQTTAEDERFFHWELEFPIAFYDQDGSRKEDSGFDAVVGNPPYRSLALGSGQESEKEIHLNYLREKYPEASEYKSNIYPMFLDLSTKIAKESRYIGYVIPNTILTNVSYSNIRTEILETTMIESVVDSEITVFDEVETGGVTIPILCKSRCNSGNSIDVVKLYAGKIFEVVGEVDQKSVMELPDSRILTTPEKFRLLTELPEESKSLMNIADFYQGIITGDNDRFLSDIQETDHHEKVVRGRDVHRHVVTWGESYILFDGEKLWSNADRKKFETSPKIITRQTSDSLVCAVDTEGVFSLDSTLLIYPDNYSSKYVSALLNSNMLNWLYQAIVPEEGEAFSQVKIENLKKLPIPDATNEDVAEIDSKYDKIHSCKKSRIALNLNLLDYLGNYSEGNNLPDVSLFQPIGANILDATTEEYEKLQIERARTKRNEQSVTIEATARYKPEDEDEFETDTYGYTETEFFEAFTLTNLTEEEATLIEAFVPVAVEEEIAGFRDSATKNISLIDRLKDITLPDPDDVADDLRRYIETKERADELDEKIEKTDQLIDEIVYDLYDLTDEEIEIVEEAVGDD